MFSVRHMMMDRFDTKKPLSAEDCEQRCGINKSNSKYILSLKNLNINLKIIPVLTVVLNIQIPYSNYISRAVWPSGHSDIVEYYTEFVRLLC
jgi:hypothetical protein